MVALVLALSVALAAGSLPPGKAYDTPINVEVKAGISLGDAIRIIARSAGLSVVVAQSPEVQARVTLDVKGKPFRQVWEGLFMGAASSLDYRVLSSGLIVVAPKSQIEAFARSKAPQAPAAAPAGNRPAGEPARQGSVPTGERPQSVPTGDRPAGERSQSVPTGDRPPAQPAPAPTPPRQVRIYPVEDPTTLANLLSSLFPEARAYALSAPKAVVVQASEADQATVQGLLEALSKQAQQAARSEAPKEPPPTNPQPAAPTPPPAAPEPEPQEAVLFPAPEGGAAMAQAIGLRFKEAKVNFLEPLRVLLVQLPASQTAKLKEFVDQLLATRPPEPKPVEKTQEKPVERSLPLGYARATTVIDLVGKLLPESKEVALAADERTNTVLLRGPQAAVAAIERLVGDLDRPIPQVDLQVRVEQLNSSNGDEIGAALEAALGPWSLKANPGSGQYGLGLEVGRTELLKLNATLKALQTAGKGRSLIDSRFTVSSGESVNLLSGGSLLIPLTSTGTGGGTNTTGLQNVEFGLELKLTPTVIPGDKIQLRVNINLGSAPTVGPGNSTLVPKQQLTSNVLLSSGNSAVLGGVISVEEKESRSGIPVLMDLPLIGGLFAQTVKSSSQNHLLIVVTAVSRLPEAVKPASTPQAVPPAPAPAQPPKPQPPAAPVAPPPPPAGFERNIPVGGQR